MSQQIGKGAGRLLATTVSASSLSKPTSNLVQQQQTTNLVNKTSIKRLSTSQSVSVTASSGAYHPEPKKIPMGLSGVAGTITAGLLIGAAISKNMASFLEENELFVPSDDDDDD